MSIAKVRETWHAPHGFEMWKTWVAKFAAIRSLLDRVCVSGER